MIADVRVIMAGATKTTHVIETSDAANVDLRGVENRLSPRDRLTIYFNGAITGRAGPNLEEVEDVPVEVLSEWIVDAGKEVSKLSWQVDRASLGPKRIEILGRVVKTLRGEETDFEIYNFLLLGSRRTGRIRLRVTERCVYRLTLQAGFTSIPHDCVSFGFVSIFGIQKTQVGRGKWRR